MKQSFYKNIIILIISIGTVIACKPSDYYYADYLKEGEIYYPGRIDSLSIIPGNQRATLRFRVSTDPKINAVKVYLRNSLSALETVYEFPISSGEHGDFKLIDLDGLKEATYTANVYSVANTGDSSRSVSASQFVYGEAYTRTLVNRLYSKIDKSNADEHFVVFNRESNLPKEGTFFPMQFTEVVYTTGSGQVKTVKITPYTDYASLLGIASSTTIKYRTAYKPIEKSLDYFYTDYAEIEYTK